MIYIKIYEVIFKLFAGAILGGLIGIERSFFKQRPGLRTFSLVSLGATLISTLSTYFPIDSASRILANIIVGIGFLGGGVIFFHEEKLIGATTAAAIWVTAAIGMAIGLGFYLEAILATILTIIILAFLPYLEEKIKKFYEKF
ncbi:MAG: MgtC/SapB family protein [Candidatus Aenigmatarchaeota archaeon]